MCGGPDSEKISRRATVTSSPGFVSAVLGLFFSEVVQIDQGFSINFLQGQQIQRVKFHGPRNIFKPRNLSAL